MDRATLLTLSRDDLIALIEAQAGQIATLVEAQTRQLAALTARIGELEAKLALPPKNPDNSSLPPSKGDKSNLPNRGKKSRLSRLGVARSLAETPDRIKGDTRRLSALQSRAGCGRYGRHPRLRSHRSAADPPIVTRVHRHRGVCPCCRKAVAAPAPQGFEPGSPFGAGIGALILHLHITQAVSFERLSRLMAEVFGLWISEGAIANILARTQTPLVAAADTIATVVRASPVVGSDRPPRGFAARPGGSGSC